MMTQTVSTQPVLLRKPRPPKNSGFYAAVNRSNSSRNSDKKSGDFQLNDFGVASSVSYRNQALPRQRYHSTPATYSGEKLRLPNSLSNEDRAAKLKPRDPDTSPARSCGVKPQVLRADDEDAQKFCQRPTFTLMDFKVLLADSEDVPVTVSTVQRSPYSLSTYSRLQKALQDRCRPRNTRLSTQQLQLSDNLLKVRRRVPHRQLLIEMTAVIREQLSKVVHRSQHCKQVVTRKPTG